MIRRSDVVLVAASGLAREAAVAIDAGSRYRVRGIVDDDPFTWDTDCGGHRVLGGLDALAQLPRTRVVVCAGKGAARRAIVQRLQQMGIDRDRFATVIHPRATVGARSFVGAGSILLAGAVVTTDARVGMHVVVMSNAVITHDDELHDFATICSSVTLAGRVTVEPEVYVGASAAVRQDCTLGAGAVIGLGAVVLRDVPAGQTWVGNPAAQLGVSSAQTSLTAEYGG